MIKKITTKFKKFISILVCAMMVSLTFPVNMLNSAAYAEDDITYSESQTTAVPCEDEDIELNGGDVLEAGSMSELQEKINKAQDGDTIKLTAQIEAANDKGYALTIENKKIIITSDANAQKIICTDEGSLLQIQGQNSQVTLKNVEIDGKDILKKNSLIKVEEGLLNIEQNAKIFNCQSKEGGAAIYCVSNGSVNVNGGSIYNCLSQLSGGAIYCEQGRIDITQGGMIYDCRSERQGGAISCWQGRIDITQGGAINNTTAYQGGAIYCGKGVVVDISGGLISGCRATEEAGAIYCDQMVILEICNGGKISNCKAVTGGAIVSTELVEIKLGQDGEILNCQATRYGGAISCYFQSKLYVNPGGKISGCTAVMGGGAIYCSSAEIYITGGEISGCSSNNHGGAIVCFGNGERINMTGGTISGCHARRGGAINGFGNTEIIEILGGNLTDCWATEAGNVIFMQGATLLSLISSTSESLKIKKAVTAVGTDLNPKMVGGYEGIYIDVEQTNFKIKNENDDNKSDDNKNDNENQNNNEIVIGATWYVNNLTSLQRAVNLSHDGDTIVLTQNIEIPDYFHIEEYALTVENKKITITTSSSDSKIIYNGRGGLLEIEGPNSGVTLKNIIIDGNNIQRTSNMPFINILNGKLNILKNAKIVNCNSCEKNIFCQYGQINISGGNIYNCKSEQGGAIYLDNAELNMMDASVVSKCHGENGGFVYCYGGKVNFQGGSIYMCDTDNDGGAFYFQSGTLEMTGGNIVACNAKKEGGAIHCLHGTLNIKQGEFFGCFAPCGGAISCYGFDARLNMMGGIISQSFAMLGGGIYNFGGIINLEGGTMANCKAIGDNNNSGRGNVIYSHSGILSLPDARLWVLRIKKANDATGIDSDPLQVGHHEGIYANKLSKVQITGYYIDDDSKQNNISVASDNTSTSGGISENIPNKYIEEGDLGTIFEEDEKDADYDEDMLNEIENEPGEGEGEYEGEDEYEGEGEDEYEYEDEDEGEDEDHGYSDNDIGKYNGLKEFLEKDPGSEIVQLDEANGIVLTAKDGIIPPGYHFVAEKIQEGSSKWNDRIKDIDTRHLTNIEKMGIYDLSIQDENGIIFTLPEKFTVTVFIPCPDGYDINELQILHISSGIDDEFDETITTVNGQNYCTFKTTHFSPYAIIDEISKNDIFEMMAPWLIGAAVIAIGAAAVVIVLKNKNKSRA